MEGPAVNRSIWVCGDALYGIKIRMISKPHTLAPDIFEEIGHVLLDELVGISNVRWKVHGKAH
jgi:hypothetical protein